MHARRVDLRPRPDRVERHRVGDPAAARLPGDGVSELLAPKRMVELEVDGEPCACSRARRSSTPAGGSGSTRRRSATARRSQPANVCRVCVVEVEGARVLAPACSRKVEAGMKVRTDSERVRLSRKLVLELLASSVDLSTTPVAPDYLERYEAEPERFGPPAPPERRPRPRADGTPRRAGRPHRRDRLPAGQGRQRALRPRLREMHPLLQVRRRLRRAVPEHVRDPRRRARLRRSHLDRARHAASRVGVRLLRQLHRRLPDRRAHVPLRVRAARGG